MGWLEQPVISSLCPQEAGGRGGAGLSETLSLGLPLSPWSLLTSEAFPADLEQLYLGLHYSDSSLSRPLEGSPLLTWKWRHSLRELDLTSQSFSEEDLQQAMAAFTQGGGEEGPPLLRFLSLTGTKVALRTVR